MGFLSDEERGCKYVIEHYIQISAAGMMTRIRFSDGSGSMHHLYFASDAPRGLQFQEESVIWNKAGFRATRSDLMRIVTMILIKAIPS